MSTYLCYIKSHCEAPDYDREIEAQNFIEAVKEFTRMVNQGNESEWSKDMIAENVTEVCPECGIPMTLSREQREGYNFEDVAECSGCGYIETQKGVAYGI